MEQPKPLGPLDPGYWTHEKIDALFDRMDAERRAEREAKAAQSASAPTPPAR